MVNDLKMSTEMVSNSINTNKPNNNLLLDGHKKLRGYDVGNPGPGLKCAHTFGGDCLNNGSHYHIKYMLHERKY